MRLRTKEIDADVETAFVEPGQPQVAPDGAAAAAELHPLIVAASRPDDPFARQARALASAISGSRDRSGGRPKVIALLSVGAPEAALLIANLAVVAAGSGQRCLLVDPESRRSVHRRMLRVPPREGPSPRDAMEAAIEATSVPRLSLLSLPLGGADGAQRARQLQGRLRPLAERFDLVLVDCSQLDDLHFATSEAEAAIIVVRRDHTLTNELKTVVDEVMRRDVHLIGSVVIQ